MHNVGGVRCGGTFCAVLLFIITLYVYGKVFLQSDVNQHVARFMEMGRGFAENFLL